LFGHQLARRDGLTDFIRNMISKPAEQTS
jgi:hypothetical protein